MAFAGLVTHVHGQPAEHHEQSDASGENLDRGKSMLIFAEARLPHNAHLYLPAVHFQDRKTSSCDPTTRTCNI